jgi:tetratricopeptide (TPR) repeat protein
VAWTLAPPALRAQDAVRVSEGQVALSTYEENAADLYPQFPAFSSKFFPDYPYADRKLATPIHHTRQWRTIVLENEYLSCRVLPDLGGHLYGCLDKTTGRQVFYANPAVRTGIGLFRGFVAMGVESSFPIAHSRVSSSPVDYGYSDRDGIGRAVVEETDRVSGMEWRVEFILRPGSAVLEQHVTLHNPTAARRGYHWWASATIELDDPHLRFVYPVKWMLAHGAGAMTPWPVNKAGIDLSDVANNRGQLGLFAHLSREPWMAVYKPAFRSGVVHYADADQVRGKKVWLWGTSDRFVKEHLTENFNSYVEMQAGMFETQPEFAFLLPGEVKTFTHYWIPFHGLGGVSRATRDVVLNLQRTDKGALIELLPTHALRGVEIRVAAGARTVLETQADLDPKVVYTKTLDAAPSPLTVDLVDHSGAVILHHVEGQYDAAPFDPKAKDPEPVRPSGASGSEADILARAEYDEQRDQFAFAWWAYRTALEKYPESAAVALAAGRTAFVLNRDDDAIRLLAPLVTKGGDNAEAAYFYGAALARSNRKQEAQTALAGASQSSAWGLAARLQLALLAARTGELPDAVRLIQALAKEANAAVRTGAFEVAILRRAGRADAARSRLRFWREQDPADNMLRVEDALLGAADDPSLGSHLASDPERILNLADRYFELGAFDDALALLDRPYPSVPPGQFEPDAVAPQAHPLLAYYRGYCRLKLGQDPGSDFKSAGTLSTRYIFPSRASSYEVLRAAVAYNDADAVAHALLGDLYLYSLDADKAIAELRRALALNPGLPALQCNLGRALLDVKRDPLAALPELLEARRLDPEDRQISEALVRLGEALPAAVHPRDLELSAESGARLADRALVRSVLDPDGAKALFTATNFPRDKQPDQVRRAYIEVEVQNLLAGARSRRCSEVLAGLSTLGAENKSLPFTFYGFGAFIGSPHIQYFMAETESACGAGKEAQKRWSKIGRTRQPIDSIDYAFPLLSNRRLGESDAQHNIADAIRSLRSSRPDLVFTQGVLQLAAGQTEEGAALLQKSARAADPLVRYLSLVALRDAGLETR